MTAMKKINDAALENVTGGATRTVYNDAVNYANLRCEPGLNSDVFLTLRNGYQVETTGSKVTKDGYTWYEIQLPGTGVYGWIAGSLIGY